MSDSVAEGQEGNNTEEQKGEEQEEFPPAKVDVKVQ